MHPGRAAQRAAEVNDGRTDADDQVQRRHQRGGGIDVVDGLLPVIEDDAGSRRNSSISSWHGPYCRLTKCAPGRPSSGRRSSSVRERRPSASACRAAAPADADLERAAGARRDAIAKFVRACRRRSAGSPRGGESRWPRCAASAPGRRAASSNRSAAASLRAASRRVCHSAIRVIHAENRGAGKAAAIELHEPLLALDDAVLGQRQDFRDDGREHDLVAQALFARDQQRLAGAATLPASAAREIDAHPGSPIAQRPW